MIPPITPGQSDVQQNMVAWKNTFNMRQLTLQNLSGTKNGVKSSNQNHRRSYSTTSVTKSLELLRVNLQNAINKDIDNVIRKYLDRFFQPAVINIKNNLGQDSVSEANIREVCKDILEQAKSMYVLPGKPNDSGKGNTVELPNGYSEATINTACQTYNPTTLLKRKEAEREADNFLPVVVKRSKPKVLSNYYNDNLGCKFSLKRDGPKWNPERIKCNTLFIMGSRANKVLGYGQTRGRLYVRHPNLLRYCGDQEDKEWLQSQNLLPANGGKIYIMLLDDIKELTESEEYRNNPNLQLQELQGFEAPDFMNAKIKNFLEYIKNEKKLMAVLDVDESDLERPPPNVTITKEMDLTQSSWKTSQLRQQIDYPNMSSDMSSLSSSVISSILAGTYTPITTLKDAK